MKTYTLLNGQTIELGELSPQLADFLAVAEDKVDDPSVSSMDLVELLWSDRNPLLEAPGLSPGRGLVTDAVLKKPAYRVLWDMESRKRIAEGRLDPEAATSEFQVSVADAAHQLGITTSAVRQAIAAGRLQSRKLGGKAHWLRQSDVDNLRVRGQPQRTEAVQLRMGSDGAGRSLSVRFDAGAVLTRSGREDQVVVAELAAWSVLAIKAAGPDGNVRYFELRPAENGFEVLHHGPLLRVQGPFEIAVKENNRQRAQAAWKTFLAAHPPAGRSHTRRQRPPYRRTSGDNAHPRPSNPTRCRPSGSSPAT